MSEGYYYFLRMMGKRINRKRDCQWN